MIRIATNIPEPFDARAEHVFRFFSAQWGIPVTVSRDQPGMERPDIFYSSNDQYGHEGVVHLPFNENLYDAECRCESVRRGDYHLWSRQGDGAGDIDVVAGAYRLLTFLDERQVPREARDGRGTFFSHDLPAARQQTAQLPLADDHARYLWQRLTEVRPGLAQAPLPKWPGGKKYAIAVTHDTDAVSLGAAKELGTNLAKVLLRRDRVFLDMVMSGLRYVGRPTENPFFGFPLWREFENSRQFRSCFYLFAKVVPLKRDINNCKSSVVEQRIDWDVLKRMAAGGWEFGFHAPIDPENRLYSFVEGKRWIEEKLGTAIYGLRHHYWALDWARPQATFQKHIDAGFRYDTSIAWKDVTGFRAATCHPFRPFDPERNQSLDIYEIPTCLMDGHVIKKPDDVSGAVAEGLAVVRQVKEQGGVAVLDWHTETACNDYNYRHYTTVLHHILEPLLEAGDAWVATPWEIAQHWQHRTRKLEAAQA